MDRPHSFALIAIIFAVAISGAWAGVFDELERLTTPESGQREFLPPEQAFVMSHAVTSDGTLQVTWAIEPGYYLYRNKMGVKPKTPGLVVAPPELPLGEIKDDPEFGRVAVFKHAVSFGVPIERWPATETVLETVVSYQGCAEDGICYPPLKKTVAFTPGDGARTPSQTYDAAAFGTLPASDRIAVELAQRSVAMTFAVFLGLGVLLSLTPCVLPMIPILSGIIVGQKQPLSTARAFALSSTYAIAMALTYALAGVAAGLLGRNLQAAFQHPAVIVSFSVVFVALALAMFGFYELQLPANLQTRLDRFSRTQRGGTFGGVAIMGALSAIIVGPCVAPPLAGALAYIGQTGSAVIGGGALFALGLGMGIPLIALGTSMGAVLPHAGPWMDAIKKIFGVIFLGVAIWFLERVLPGPVVLVLWALLAIGSAIFLGALDHLEATSSAWRRLSKGVGLAVLVYGAVLVVGAAVGGDDPVAPLAPLLAGAGDAHPATTFIEVKGIRSVETELERATQTGRAVMLDFYADWCVECKHLERETFSNAKVAAKLGEMVLLRADVTANDLHDQALMSRYGLFGPPAVLFFKDGEELRHTRLVGFVNAEEFTTYLDRL